MKDFLEMFNPDEIKVWFFYSFKLILKNINILVKECYKLNLWIFITDDWL